MSEHTWTVIDEREWVRNDGSPFRVWKVRGGRYVVMAHQPGRLKKGENPTYVRLIPAFLTLGEAIRRASAAHDAIFSSPEVDQ